MTGIRQLTHRCGDCAHARWTLTRGKRIKKGEHGLCDKRGEIVIRGLPTSVMVNMATAFHRTAIWPDDGTDCECYEQMLEIKPIDGTEPNLGIVPLDPIGE